MMSSLYNPQFNASVMKLNSEMSEWYDEKKMCMMLTHIQESVEVAFITLLTFL